MVGVIVHTLSEKGEGTLQAGHSAVRVDNLRYAVVVVYFVVFVKVVVGYNIELQQISLLKRVECSLKPIKGRVLALVVATISAMSLSARAASAMPHKSCTHKKQFALRYHTQDPQQIPRNSPT